MTAPANLAPTSCDLNTTGTKVSYAKTFSAAVISVNFTSYGTVYVTVNVYCIDRGNGDKYIVETFRVDVPQNLYLMYISEFNGVDTGEKILSLIAQRITEIVPENLRRSNDENEIAAQIDIGPWLRWKYPIYNGNQWKCEQCAQMFPANSVRWIKNGSTNGFFTRRNFCFDCGKIKNRRHHGTYIILTHTGSRIIMTEDEAETYMSICL